MSQIAYFNLPDVGEGLTEAEIVTWKVKAGDSVTVNQIIVEIETAKSLVELPVPFAGEVSELLAKEGDTVEVGKPIIAVKVAGAVGAVSTATNAIKIIDENEAAAAAAASAASVRTFSAAALSAARAVGISLSFSPKASARSLKIAITSSSFGSLINSASRAVTFSSW